MHRVARIRQLATGGWAVQQMEFAKGKWVKMIDPWEHVSEHSTERGAELAARDLLDGWGSESTDAVNYRAGEEPASPRHSAFWMWPRRCDRVAV